MERTTRRRRGIIASFGLGGALLGGALVAATAAIPGPESTNIAQARANLAKSQAELAREREQTAATDASLPAGCGKLVLYLADRAQPQGGDRSPVIVRVLEAPKQPCGDNVFTAKRAVEGVLDANQNLEGAQAGVTFAALDLNDALGEPARASQYESTQHGVEGVELAGGVAAGLVMGLVFVGRRPEQAQ